MAAYVEAGHAATEAEAETLIRRRLAESRSRSTTSSVFASRIDQGQVGIEGRIRVILRFIGRNPAAIRERVESCLEELAHLDDHVELPSRPAPSELPRAGGKSRFPRGRSPSPRRAPLPPPVRKIPTGSGSSRIAARSISLPNRPPDTRSPISARRAAEMGSCSRPPMQRTGSPRGNRPWR